MKAIRNDNQQQPKTRINNKTGPQEQQEPSASAPTSATTVTTTKSKQKKQKQHPNKPARTQTNKEIQQ